MRAASAWRSNAIAFRFLLLRRYLFPSKGTRREEFGDGAGNCRARVVPNKVREACGRHVFVQQAFQVERIEFAAWRTAFGCDGYAADAGAADDGQERKIGSVETPGHQKLPR
ncbi:hypothetical protein VTA46_27615 [Burkholderia cenocepacia]|nr:hypothetical protein [Burkholderia cenocepacia]MEC4774381.1 hypothetical protein [Burkholderia cenocepacia]